MALKWSLSFERMLHRIEVFTLNDINHFIQNGSDFFHLALGNQFPEVVDYVILTCPTSYRTVLKLDQKCKHSVGTTSNQLIGLFYQLHYFQFCVGRLCPFLNSTEMQTENMMELNLYDLQMEWITTFLANVKFARDLNRTRWIKVYS